MKCVCFKVKGDYGHYRPYYTTSSPMTYSLMPPTSMFGLIGAILGLEKSESLYYHTLSKAGLKVGIGLLTPVRKTFMGTNLIMTKGDYWVPTGKNSNGVHTPTKFEYVVNQEYLIFVAMKDGTLLEELAGRLKEHRFAYGISLGLAGLMAQAQLVCFDEAQKIDTFEYVQLDSSIQISEEGKKIEIDISPGIQYCRERYVKSFGSNRIPLEYVDVLFSVNAEKVRVKSQKVYEMNGYKFAFLND